MYIKQGDLILFFVSLSTFPLKNTGLLLPFLPFLLSPPFYSSHFSINTPRPSYTMNERHEPESEKDIYQLEKEYAGQTVDLNEDEPENSKIEAVRLGLSTLSTPFFSQQLHMAYLPPQASLTFFFLHVIAKLCLSPTTQP